MRAPSLLVLLLVQLVLLPGCRFDEPPDLLSVNGMTPGPVTRGDGLELSGSGFPEGRAAKITFRGELLRPGRAPERADVVAAGVSTSAGQVRLTVDRALEHAFCGGRDMAVVTSFRGDVQVAFAPRTPGAPPVVGTFRGARVDFVPASISRERLAERLEQGQRALHFYGLDLEEAGPQAGLLVRTLDASGAAKRAGLLPDDVIVEADGVSVRAAGDLFPAPGRRTASLRVRRPGVEEPLHIAVDVTGLRPAAPQALEPAVLLVGTASLGLLLAASPVSRGLGWLERALRVAATASGLRRRRRWWENLLDTVGQRVAQEVGGGRLRSRLARYVLFLIVAGAFTLLGFGRRLAADHLDVAVLTMGAVTALVVFTMAAGGARAGGWSLRKGALAAIHSALLVAPMLAAVTLAVLLSGSLVFRDVVGVQGPMPWQWSAFRNPGLFVLFLLAMLSAVPQRATRSDLVEAEGDHRLLPTASPGRQPLGRLHELLALAEWGYILTLCGLATGLFLGGWQLPFVPDGAQQAGLAYPLLGILLFHGKCAALLMAACTLRCLAPGVAPEHLAGLALRRMLPLAAAACAVAWTWPRRTSSPLTEMGLDLTGPLVLGLAVSAAALLGHRLVVASRSPGPHPTVNPWL